MAEGDREIDEPQDPKTVSRLDDSIEPGVWRYARADRATVIIDGADYFSVMQAVMLEAKYRIFLIGWDFDTRIHLGEGRRWYERGWKSSFPSRLGSFIAWLARHRPTLEIRLLKWSFGIFKWPMRGSMWWDLARWTPHRRIDFKFDSAHPVGCSHHQKIAVIDSRLAVCGGIDMTSGRRDTREHRVEEPMRNGPDRHSHGPWHDATMMMEGEIAEALGELGRDRWIRAGGKPLMPIKPPERSLWPDLLEAQFENVEIGIARTRASYREWDGVNEIEQLFVTHIKRAKRFIYAESQYFASRAVGEAMLSRLAEDDPPEIVIVHPAHAEGWLEKQAMDHARAEMVRAIEEADHRSRFSLWTPKNGETDIYVHAKIMIVDDEIVRIGSANLNNRSMGLDSECDVFIDAARTGNEHAADAITALRVSLLAEHCGVEEDEMSRMLSHHDTIAEVIDHTAGQNDRHLARYHPPELADIQKTVAESEMLDPEDPEDLFEPFAKGGFFREGSKLKRFREKFRRSRQ